MHHLLPTPGTFLDIGCNHPIDGSNTYALEQLGWTGLLVDCMPEACQLCRDIRTSKVEQVDAKSNRWLPAHYDYLSLDVDDATAETLYHLVADGVTFTVATIEHDSYRLGPGPKDQMRHILLNAGYSLSRADITCGGKAFEDWWIDANRLT